MPTRSLLVAVTFAIAACGGASPGDDVAAERATDVASAATYQCESGGTVTASYPSDSTAVVDYQGQTLQMTLAVSGSGARYVGGGLEWWTKGSGPGSEGTIFRHEAGGTTGEMVDQCEQPGSAM